MKQTQKMIRTQLNWRPRLWDPVIGSAILLSLTSALLAQSTIVDQPTADEEEIIVLSPFEVSAFSDQGYEATSSLAGSRLNTSLRDISSPITAITTQFLEDTGVNKIEDLLIYTTNTEVAGVNGNFFGSHATDVGFATNQSLRPHTQNRVRGLDNADVTRDFWVTEIPLDAYNVSGVEIQRGPNSVLYGLGSPAGIINYSLKTPLMNAQKYGAAVTIDSFGSYRATTDINRVIIPDTLAIRINGLKEKRKFEQSGKYEDNERLTISPRWTPKMGSGVFTQFTANFETGNLVANRPVLTPPVDFMSNWYEIMGKYTAPDEFVGVPNAIAPYFTGFNGAGNGSWYDQHGVIFGDPNSSAVGGPGVADVIRQRGGNPFGTFHGVANFTENATNPGHVLADKSYYQNNPEAMGIISAMEAASGRTFGGFTGWRGRQITDTSVFDFWNDDVAGPNNTVWNKFDTLNLSGVQTYLDGRVGIEVVYDKQNYRDGYNRNINDPLRIGIDINTHVRAERDLPNNASGLLHPAAANPNFGRPYLVSSNSARENQETRESARATAFYKFNLKDFTDSDSLLTKVFGEQTLTAVASNQAYHHFNYDWQLYNIGEGFGPYSGEPLNGIHYLGSAVNPASANSITGLGITGITAVQQPPTSISAQLIDQRGPTTIGQFATVGVDSLNASTARDRLLTGGSDFKTETSTRAFIWQSRLFSDNVVGLFGLREDNFSKQVKGVLPFSAPDARDNPGAVQGRDNPLDPTWSYDPDLNLATSGTSRTYGVMVHSPEFINKRLPWGTRVSLGYNQASNINPSNVGFDIFRDQIPAQSGESKDYSVLISTLNDRVTLRGTWYESSQQFASGPGPSVNGIRESLQRTLNGIMVEASYQGNTRVNTTPEFIVNKWFFGGDGASSSFVPGSWNSGNAAQRQALLNGPLQVRTAAATWGDPTTHVHPNGQVIAQPDISGEEVAYRKSWFESRSDSEWFRPLGDVGSDLRESLSFRRVPNGGPGAGFTWASSNVPAFKNTTDITTKGVELEATANVTRNWRVMVNASKVNAVNSNVMGESMTRYYEAMRAVAKDGFSFNDVKSGGFNWGNGSDYWSRTGFAQIDEWGDSGTSNNHQMLGEKWVVSSGGFGVEEGYINAKAAENRAVGELRKWRFNVVNTYEFTEGRFDGLGLGGAVRYQGRSNLGYYPKWNNDAGVWVTDLDKPIAGPTEMNFDLWAYYKHKLNERVDMTIQLNVRNAFADRELIPISANPDGSIGQYRISATPSFELTTRFEF